MRHVTLKAIICLISIAVLFFKLEIFLLRSHNRQIEDEIRIATVQKFSQLRKKEDTINYKYFNCGSTNAKVITLTFDDGPYADRTPQILEMLSVEKVPATFFLVGTNVDKNPQLVQKIVFAGHEIGNHTYFHRTSRLMSVENWNSEISRANKAISNIVGLPPRFFRAPGCHYTKEALEAIKMLNMIRVDTSNNGFDWNATNAATVLTNVLKRLAPGDVILLHDRDPQLFIVLPQLIHEARSRGFCFISLIEMMNYSQTNKDFDEPYYIDNQGIQLPAHLDPDLIKQSQKNSLHKPAL